MASISSSSSTSNDIIQKYINEAQNAAFNFMDSGDTDSNVATLIALKEKISNLEFFAWRSFDRFQHMVSGQLNLLRPEERGIIQAVLGKSPENTQKRKERDTGTDQQNPDFGPIRDEQRKIFTDLTNHHRSNNGNTTIQPIAERIQKMGESFKRLSDSMKEISSYLDSISSYETKEESESSHKKAATTSTQNNAVAPSANNTENNDVMDISGDLPAAPSSSTSTAPNIYSDNNASPLEILAMEAEALANNNNSNTFEKFKGPGRYSINNRNVEFFVAGDKAYVWARNLCRIFNLYEQEMKHCQYTRHFTESGIQIKIIEIPNNLTHRRNPSNQRDLISESDFDKLCLNNEKFREKPEVQIAVRNGFKKIKIRYDFLLQKETASPANRNSQNSNNAKFNSTQRAPTLYPIHSHSHSPQLPPHYAPMQRDPLEPVHMSPPRTLNPGNPSSAQKAPMLRRIRFHSHSSQLPPHYAPMQRDPLEPVHMPLPRTLNPGNPSSEQRVLMWSHIHRQSYPSQMLSHLYSPSHSSQLLPPGATVQRVPVELVHMPAPHASTSGVSGSTQESPTVSPTLPPPILPII